MRGYIRFTMPTSANPETMYQGFIDGDKIEILAGEITQAQGKGTGVFHSQNEIHLLAPILPSKIVAVGRNYVDHITELGNEVPKEPLIFYKPTSSIIGPGQDIIYPVWTENLHFEGELAVVIGKKARDIPESHSQEYIFGYTIANDVSARDKQVPDGQWWRAKGSDTFCPLGPVIVPAQEFDPTTDNIVTTVSGVQKQCGAISHMINPIPRLIAYISSAITLFPGDVILTGTPAGVGPLYVGDTVTVQISGIGELTNFVR